MSSNTDIVKKADLALADLSANGGLLNPTQTNTFIQTLIDSPTIMSRCRVVSMPSPTHKINKIGFGQRILRPAVPSVALPDSQRAKPDLGQVVLQSTEIMAELHLPYDVLEDNIEGGNINASMGNSAGGLHDTLVTLIGRRAALDLEELALRGDTTSNDPYLKLKDGFLKRCNAHIVDASAKEIDKSIFKAAIKAMPNKYLRNRADLDFYVSTDKETEYRDYMSNRLTGLGDSALVSANALSVHGSPIVAASMMPDTMGLYTNPNNLIFGVQRRINMEYDKDIRSRVFIIVLTCRVDFQVEELGAAVQIANMAP